MVFKPVQLYFAETFQCCFSSLEPSKSPTLHCANIEVINCEDLKNTLQEYFPKVNQVKVYQHWFCGQTPKMDICYVGWHGL